ncbi:MULTISPECIES: ABC transporter substrate-binding protein [Bradyrhizobium]|uniref:ABC transporter substrate-binding protein n=1 Tax=Bradyrhizobium TaxID=374 RepID=UPI001EDBD70F|nr:ABC transporter substrate-binding protein [Bradyrhizobium zhengyangense]MCG2642447.1 ABC transporter substrate-binding protein [Bradyrhizobium zhengyangense]
MPKSKCNVSTSVRQMISCAFPLLFLFAVAASGETSATPKRLGILAGVVCPTSDAPAYWGPMLQRLADRGWVEGHNLVVDCVTAGGHLEQAAALARELVARRPDVLLGASTPTVRALKEATSTIPIVTAGSDALRNHIVNDLAHPDANITGVEPMIFDLTAKRMELLKDILPRLSKVAIILFKGIRTDQELIETDISAAAQKIGFTSQVFYPDPADVHDLDKIFAQLATDRFDAAYIFSTPFTFGNRKRIAEVAKQYRVPTVSDNTDFARAGVLVTYGLDLGNLVGDTAEYIDKLLRGAKPADLPLQEPTKFELAINLKTAKALGVDVPQDIMVRANEVIE